MKIRNVFLPFSIILFLSAPFTQARHHDEEPMAILYALRDFRGDSYVLKSGDAVRSFEQIGDGRWSYLNDEVSSIEIIGDFTIEIFTQNGFQGRSLEIRRSIPNLDLIEVENFENTHHTPPRNRQRTDNWNNEISSLRALAFQAESKIVLYEKAGLAGESMVLSPDQSIENLSRHTRSWSSWNDAISSLEVLGPYTLRLYEHPQFKGRSIDLSGEIPDLQDFKFANSIFDWDNRASSIEIIPAETSVVVEEPPHIPPPVLHTPAPPPIIIEKVHHNHPPVVLFFEDSHMNGEALGFFENEDFHNLEEISLKYKNWNDEISSIDVRADVDIHLYEHADFQGRHIHITESVRSLSSIKNESGRYENWNDRISSVRVVLKANHDHPENEELPPVSAKAYGDANFSGESLLLREDTEYPNLSQFHYEHGNWNDVISSIRFEKEVIIELYSDINFRGEKIRIDKDQRNLDRVRTMNNRYLRWNDAVSSLRVISKTP